IPNSVTTIGYSAFSYCYGLTSVTIGNSVTTIGGLAFCGCSGLTSVTIPNSVTTIGDYAIYGCSGLTSVTIGNSVTTIGQGAFYGCSALTSVTFLGNACQNAIGEMAFMNVGDPNPALLTLPNSWTGTLPSEDGYWYGGKFELSKVPTALPTLFGANVDANKFLHNGQLIIRKNNKTYNTLGAEL
ncbi:MAG: leucine-rich repeat domain-containing protein, partial [Bacteroidales bacterium]|nr:leucine-rich repeat domain-containing protein [Bacteroidales bacterium]